LLFLVFFVDILRMGRQSIFFKRNVRFTKTKGTRSSSAFANARGKPFKVYSTLLDTSARATLQFIANIPATDIPVMSKKTDIALLLKAQYVPAENKSSLSDCYIQKLRFGKFKGKTAAEVLLFDPTAKSDMESTRDLLQKNVENSLPKERW